MTLSLGDVLYSIQIHVFSFYSTIKANIYTKMNSVKFELQILQLTEGKTLFSEAEVGV